MRGCRSATFARPTQPVIAQNPWTIFPTSAPCRHAKPVDPSRRRRYHPQGAPTKRAKARPIRVAPLDVTPLCLRGAACRLNACDRTDTSLRAGPTTRAPPNANPEHCAYTLREPDELPTGSSLHADDRADARVRPWAGHLRIGGTSIANDQCSNDRIDPHLIRPGGSATFGALPAASCWTIADSLGSTISTVPVVRQASAAVAAA